MTEQLEARILSEINDDGDYRYFLNNCLTIGTITRAEYRYI